MDYLAKAFPAEAVPKLNINTAMAIDFESALSLRRSQAAAVVEYRTKNGKFKSIDISRELFADKNAGHGNNSVLRGDFSSIKPVQQPSGTSTTPGATPTTPGTTTPSP